MRTPFRRHHRRPSSAMFINGAPATWDPRAQVWVAPNGAVLTNWTHCASVVTR